MNDTYNIVVTQKTLRYLRALVSEDLTTCPIKETDKLSYEELFRLQQALNTLYFREI